MKSIIKRIILITSLIYGFCSVYASDLTILSNHKIKGINYDPASTQYINAQKNYDVNTMRAIIDQNLQTIKRMGFNTIKTFYTEYCTNKPTCVDIAAEAYKYQLKVLLGVYVFPDHLDWSDVQVEAAITDINANIGNTIIGVVIGNEDIYNYDGHPNPTIAQYIDNNIKKIQTETDNAVPVFTAQRQQDWQTMINGNDPYGIIHDSDAIGTNIYPFWGESPEKIHGKSVALSINTSVAQLESSLATTPWKGKPIIVTEEGWASGGTASGRKIYPGIKAQADYFHSWLFRKDNFDSYYFAAFDKNQDSINNPKPDADTEFGLCNSDGTTKDLSLINCQ